MLLYYSALLSISNRAWGHCDKQNHEVAPKIPDLHRNLHLVESPPLTWQSTYSVLVPRLGYVTGEGDKVSDVAKVPNHLTTVSSK